MFNLAPALCALGLLAGCATAPSPVGLPDLPGRTLLGYQCTADPECGAVQRCYRKFPTASIGRCVHQAYFDAHERACRFDGDCQRTEVCERRSASVRLGACASRFEESPDSREGLAGR